ncbi:LamB/YcsF family protein [Evansella tamaricis]|uniref:5-oxoprolinase subunit A n=1 Tax=Evansella tamaricis TaxID=2069301 RepID=A0ABS6JLU6_9BACI|nr:LamB/YcsF family protein [Evansella tamaricis]
MTWTVDVNSDLGEDFGIYKIGQDEDVITYISSANIACGYHAGDHNVMHHTVKLAVENNVGIGAHPGFQDLQGFGRRVMDVTPEDVYNMVVYQTSALQGFAALYGQDLQHVKPHGALYNMAAKDRSVADAVARAVLDASKGFGKVPGSGPVLYALAGSQLVKSGHYVGVKVVEEVFVDRTYEPDGTLTPRSKPGSVIKDINHGVIQAVRMVKDGLVTATDGTDISIQADTICVHGDGPHALQFVRELRKTFAELGINVQKPGGN